MAEAMRTSAVNLAAETREQDALRRAQRAHEPSMEEILASIRTIIAEERQPAGAAEPQPAKGLEPKGAPAAPQIVYSNTEPASRAPAPSQRSEPAPEPVAPRAARRQTESAAAVTPRVSDKTESTVSPDPAVSSDATVPPGGDEAPLLSPEAGQAVASAFDALSASLAARSAELAEEMAREMLRPMLKAWLDENLPTIVERLVKAEIDRIARATR